VVKLGDVLLGPLAGCECRRAIGRGWLIVTRVLAAASVVLATLIIFWFCWFGRIANPDFRPLGTLRVGLAFVAGMILTVALTMAPAVMAGALAGERERGALGLLLTTWVTPREIVSGRLAGKFSQVLMILLAMAPGLVLFAGLTGMHGTGLVALLALPVALAAGVSGLAAGVSAVSKRARDALMTVYLVLLLFLIVPLARYFLSGALIAWIAPLNPFAGLNDLIWDENPIPAALSIAYWLTIGLGGLAWSAHRLAPVCLEQADGLRIGRRGRRRRAVPPIGDRPMLWKELHIEHARALGGLGWWIGAALTLLLGPGSLILGLMIAIDLALNQQVGGAEFATWILQRFVGDTGDPVTCLIQWGIGLRAAVSIASERERGTWDAILTSPLEGRSIVLAKLCGSLYALRWLVGSAIVAWSVAWGAGAIGPEDYFTWVLGTLAVGAFMAAVGLRTSLTSSSATRASAVTIGAWLGAWVVVSIVSWIIVILLSILYAIFNAMDLIGTANTAVPIAPGTSLGWISIFWEVAWIITTNGLYLMTTLILLGTTMASFDQLAGRRSGTPDHVARRWFTRHDSAKTTRSPGDPASP
jgi:ABC-type Na+ efflux pump permease subunit